MRVKSLKQSCTHKKQRFLRHVIPLMLGLGLMFFLVGSATGAGVIMRASTDSAGTQATNASYTSAVSADGRYVVFESAASDLVSGDTNGVMDIFRKDTLTGVTKRISLTTYGAESNGLSHTPNFSADGRWVTFTSSATNLIGVADSNGVPDIFVRDTLTDTTTRVSTSSSGGQGNYASDYSSISGDGRHVAFRSYASNLVPGDTNWVHDVFVKDTLTGATTRVSTSSSGVEGNDVSLDDVAQFPAISNDGRYVAFHSWASNLVPGDTNGVADVFVKNTQTNVTTIVSTDSAGVQGNWTSYSYTISADGRYVAFYSAASNLVTGDSNGAMDVFVKDRSDETTTRVSTDASGGEANYSSYLGSISADGRYVSFYSTATDLVSGDTNSVHDVFVKDTLTEAITRISINSSLVEGNSFSLQDAISADGRFSSFRSLATNLVPGDTNGYDDVFYADTSIACTPGAPALALARTDVYWASYADYLARDLSVDFSVENTGTDAAYIIQITGSTASSGVSCLTCPAPVAASLGNLVGGASHALTLKYDIPASVSTFSATVSATAKDGCGNGYSYP